MSEIRVNTVKDAEGSGAPTFPYGAVVTGIVTASGGFSGSLTGAASTATASGTAYGLTGTPNINVATVTANGAVVTGIMTATDFNTTSDASLKTNINVIDSAIDKIVKINGVSFDWKETGNSSAGVIAQDVEQVFPQVINEGEGGIKSVNYNGLIGLLIEAVKEQNKIILELKQQITDK